ncbi:MAG TPA: adenylate kinase [Armatimonadetes bacterium]|nr:adenylate kinase [Armatimonadota bacterium]
MQIILLGPPGSGKGTQAAMLAETLNLAHIATGDIFREEIQHGTELGKKVQLYLRSGELVPDDIVIQILESHLRKVLDASKDGFVLDGFPRTEVQAEALDALLQRMGLTLDAVVLIDVDDDEIIERLSGRRICPKCGAVYHVRRNPPKEAGKCDRCGAELIQRADDRVDVIRHRLKVYSKQTAPLIEHYRVRGILHRVNGMGDLMDVHHRIVSVLGGANDGSKIHS